MEKTALVRTKKTVFLVDDHPLIRDSLSRLIGEEIDLKVSGCADTAESAITAIERLKPDVIVIDVGLPGKSGLELIRFLMEQNPSALILVLSMHDEAIYTSRALKAGARGYVSKSEATEKVILAIRRLLGGGLYISEAIAESLALGLHRKTIEAGEGELSPLSDRELEVFRLLASGRDTTEIAKTLSVSLKTVQSYCARIKEKLNLRNATELLQAATRWFDRQNGI